MCERETLMSVSCPVNPADPIACSVCVRERERDQVNEIVQVALYSLLHVDSNSIKSSNLNLFGLFSTECGKRDVES